MGSKKSELIEIKPDNKKPNNKNGSEVSPVELVEERVIEGIKVIKINNDFSMMNIGKIQSVLDDYLYNKKEKNLIIDLTALDFIDSTSIGILVKTTMIMRQFKGIMALIPNEKINYIFNMTNLFSLVKIFTSEKEAVKFIKSN